MRRSNLPLWLPFITAGSWAQCHGMAWLVVEKELDPRGAEANTATEAIALARDAVDRLIASFGKC